MTSVHDRRPPAVMVATVINALFSVIAVLFGIVDSFSLAKEFLSRIPLLDVIARTHDAIRLMFSHWWERVPFFGFVVLSVVSSG